MTARNALLGACLALPLAAYGGSAIAGPPSAPQTITIPPGAVVLILPSSAEMAPPAAATALPANDPLLRMVAEQDAMMRNMMADMNAAFAQPTWPFTRPIGPSQLNRTIQAAFGGLPTNVPGAGMVFTSVSGGPGVCTQQMTYVYPANGAKPQVTVTHSGNACGQLGVTGPNTVMQPVPPQAPTAAPSHGPRLWTISDPPQQIAPNGTPRS